MRLVESVAFDSPAPASDGQGGAEMGWTEEHTCRAHFRYLRGSETVQASRLAGIQPVVISVRLCAALSDISTEWVIRDVRRSDTYNITSFIPSDDRNWLEITATSGGAV
ncbi:MAG: head-tail adaptor protein [Pikeienuella sp.]